MRLALLSRVARGLALSPGCSDGDPVAYHDATLGPWPARATSTRMSLWYFCPEQRFTVAQACCVTRCGVAYARFEPLGADTFLATFEDLLPDTEYTYETSCGSRTRRGSFRTLPASGGLVRLAIGADIHPGSAPYDVFDIVRSRRPHIYLGLGDQVYADLGPDGPTATSIEAFDELYLTTWNDASLDACWSNVPALLVWDDHEVWNDRDGTHGGKRVEIASSAYRRFQHTRTGSDEAWTCLELGPASMFVLDTRSFRAANDAPDGADKSMLGAAQRDALLDWISTCRAPVRILASPTPFHRYADTGEDAWAHGFAFERALILEAIERAGAEHFVIVSGDQHWPAVVANTLPNGERLLELQCTPIAAFARPPPPSPTPDFLYVGDGSVGFGELTIDGRVEPPVIRFAWIDRTGTELFIHTFT